MNGNPLSSEELQIIKDMKILGFTNAQIADRIGRSETTVQRESKKYLIAKSRVENGVYCWLQKWWHWDVPKREEPKPPSQFRTPYNYPRMWGSNDGRR